MTPSFPTRRTSDLIGSRHQRRFTHADKNSGGQQLAEIRCKAGGGGSDAPQDEANQDQVPPIPAVDYPAERHRHDTVECRESKSDEQTDLGVRQMHRRSEEHTSELQSLIRISYAVFCLKKKKIRDNTIKQLN